MLVVAACAAACAGNGEGLDQNGQPITPAAAAAAARHRGFPVDPGQRLHADLFEMSHRRERAGRPATRRRAQLQLAGRRTERREPGSVAGQSGQSGCQLHGAEDRRRPRHRRGDKCRFGETPLPQATIDAIRQWITNGAPNAAGASPAATAMFAVQTTAPLDSAIVKAPVRRIVVAFSQELDASLVNDTTVEPRANRKPRTRGCRGARPRRPCRSPLDSRRKIPPSC